MLCGGGFLSVVTTVRFKVTPHKDALQTFFKIVQKSTLPFDRLWDRRRLFREKNYNGVLPQNTYRKKLL